MKRSTEEPVFTIGHSTHDADAFIALLRLHKITAVCDVRSKPYSRVNPQFNRETLRKALRSAGVSYVFLGTELGARSDDPACYDHGKVQYARLAASESFRKGLQRVQKGLRRYRIALMCAEKEPLDCHRTILLARYLEQLGIGVNHILSDGSIEDHSQTVKRLIHKFNLSENDLFRSREDVAADAYRLQEERIAYSVGEGSETSEAESVLGSRIR